MSLLPGSSMSKQGIFKNIKERLWKPSKKRQKLQDEDDWCDALNYLSLDSDDEYFDAPEPEQQVKPLPPRRKRKIARGKELSENKLEKKSEMHQPPIRPCTAPSTSGVRSRRTYRETSEERQGQGSRLQPHSGVSRLGQQDSSTSTPKNTNPLGDKGYNTASSFSSESDNQAGFKWSPTMSGYADKGGIPDSKLEKLAKALPGEEYRNVRSLGQNLGFNRTKLYGYCGYGGKPKDSTGILRMLRDWKENTPDAKQISGLLEALKKANLKHLADDFHSQEGQPFDRNDLSAPSTSTTKKTEPVRSGYGRSNTAPSSSSEADVHVGPKQSATSDDPSQSQLPMKDYTDKGGLTEAKLKTVADAIGDNFDKIRLLGEKLGFSRYWIKNGPRGISGTLRMLHDWKPRTAKAEQMPKLLAALKSSQLQNVADMLDREQGKLEKRKVTVTLMTSWHLSSIEGLKQKLINLRRVRPDLIEAVKVLVLPFSGLQRFTFTEDVDIMVLCHSIVNRRFGITNVTDSLYDEFLDYCNTDGKERIVVIAHDFRQEKDEVRAVTMNTFEHTQWSTFEKAGLVMICGMMDKTPEIQEKDWKSLVKFLEDASKSTPTIVDISQTTLLKINTSDTKQKLNKSEKDKKGKNIFGTTSSSSPKPAIYICTSCGLYSVKGLKEKLQPLLKQSLSKYEIREQELPYSRLEDFKFPPEVDRTDAMILCHSVQAGFSITDVPNSIYDEFLKYCNRVFGK
eukprot:XP_011676268.1 PREDICTED: uncharacterized protein LOC100891443 [Strongylocentrotus purpuratus]